MRLELGTKIRVNKGEVETLIKIESPYGLFEGESGHKVVRNIIGIKHSEVLNIQKNEQATTEQANKYQETNDE